MLFVWQHIRLCTQWIRRVCVVFALLFVALPLGYPVTIEITNDPATMAGSKNIWMLVKLAPSEQGVFKQGLCFSVDNPSICLASWRASLNPTLVYNRSFHKTGRMFLPGSALSLHLNDQAITPNQLGACLAQSNVYVHGLVALKNGKVKPFSVKAPLGHSWWQDEAPTPTTVVMNQAQVVPPVPQQVLPVRSLKPVADVWQELSVVNNLARLWTGFVGLIHHVLALAQFWHWYPVALTLWALLTLKRRYYWLRFIVPLSGIWEREVRRFLLLISLLGLVRMSVWWMPLHYSLYIAAQLCGGGMCYASLTPPFEETFLGRLKGLIGFILGMLILPLLAKAWLLQMGLC